jgi:hypothetical protein
MTDDVNPNRGEHGFAHAAGVSHEGNRPSRRSRQVGGRPSLRMSKPRGRKLGRLLRDSRYRMHGFRRLAIWDELLVDGLAPQTRYYSVKAEAYVMREDSALGIAFILLTILSACVLFTTFLILPIGLYTKFLTIIILVVILLVWSFIFGLNLRRRLVSLGMLRLQLYGTTISVLILLGSALALLSSKSAAQAMARSLYPEIEPSVIVNAPLGGVIADLSGAFIAAGLFLAAVVTQLLLTLSLLKRIRLYVRSTFYPDLAIVAELQMILIEIEEKIHSWADFGAKRRLMQHLEDVAFCLERGFPRRLRSGDPRTDLWLGQQAKEAATALRDLKRSIISPRADSRDRFITWISMHLKHALRGEWESFERIAPQPLSKPQQLARIFSALRRVAVGLLPLASLFAVEKFLGPISEPLSSYLRVGSILWLAVTYIDLLDPGFPYKLSALKDLASLLPSRRQGDG